MELVTDTVARALESTRVSCCATDALGPRGSYYRKASMAHMSVTRSEVLVRDSVTVVAASLAGRGPLDSACSCRTDSRTQLSYLVVKYLNDMWGPSYVNPVSACE